MKLARRRIPKLAATSLMLAGCADSGSVPEKFFVEEIDDLATDFCLSNRDCFSDGDDDESDLDECRFYVITMYYSSSLINDQAECDQAIADLLECYTDAPCDEEEPCEEEGLAFQQLCPKTVTEGP